jgi:alpha-D-glucose phosphate-specific phosphoglucomutase
MIKFGTGGWRALIGEDFTKENVQTLSQAVADLLKARHCAERGFVIGYDRRFLSDKAARWIAEVLAGNGIPVFFIDKVAPTPLIMFTVKKLETGFGAAVTASHNPADYNGVKIFTDGGRDATETVTDEIESFIAALDPKAVSRIDFESSLQNGLIRPIDPFNEYIDTILGMIDTEAIKNRKLKVILDPMFGVSKTCLQTILLTARCEVEVINDRHDTLFGGRLPSPSTHTLQRLRDMVVERHYDIGIGTDGDADRLGIIDEKGDFIHPNNILALLYYYLLKFKGWKGGVVRNLATTHLLDKIAAGFGETCFEVPVGFKHISSMMEAQNALIGGESSGGLTIRGHIRGKDGVFAASLLIELLSVTQKSLSELLEEIHQQFGYFYMVENDCRFKPQDKERLQKLLFEDKALPDFGYAIARRSYADGVKVYFENGGWVIARFSGTEPLLRIFAEMDNEAAAQAVGETMKTFLTV